MGTEGKWMWTFLGLIMWSIYSKYHVQIFYIDINARYQKNKPIRKMWLPKRGYQYLNKNFTQIESKIVVHCLQCDLKVLLLQGPISRLLTDFIESSNDRKKETLHVGSSVCVCLQLWKFRRSLSQMIAGNLIIWAIGKARYRVIAHRFILN